MRKPRADIRQVCRRLIVATQELQVATDEARMTVARVSGLPADEVAEMTPDEVVSYLDLTLAHFHRMLLKYYCR